MTTASFSLVNNVPVTIQRHALGSYVNGNWVEGVEQDVIINANIHPFSDYQVMLLPEADRTKSWMWVFTSDLIRSKKEGQYGADRFTWNGDLYEIMATSVWTMQIRDHYEGRAARVELSPN